MPPRAWLFTFALVAVVLSGCATTTAGSYVERGLNLATYATYDWGPADALPAGDARLVGDPFFRDTIEGAVEKQLAARGFDRAASGTPDLLIHYHACITRRIDVNRIDREHGYCYGDDCGVRVIEYEAGTLVLDLVDARTNKVIWRGWARNTIDDELEDRDEMQRTIHEAVTRMFARLPRTF